MKYDVLNYGLNYRFESKFNSIIKINAPYLDSAVIAGVDGINNVNLPVSAKIQISNNQIYTGAQVEIKPIFTTQV